jgi:hypothetical protein
MTFGTVSRMESAKSAPAWATVVQLIDALDVSLLELLPGRWKKSAATPEDSRSREPLKL